jgi:TetR/AcrR family transcriptional regulator, regulator of autoinduction and epiphytic fitness
MTTLRERRRQQLHAEILSAARQLIQEKGLGGMSMDDVAAQAGVSKPTLYSYFATKEDLVVSAITQRLDIGIAAIEAEPDPPQPLDRLCSLMHEFLVRQIEGERTTLRPWSPEIFQLLCNRADAVTRLQRMERGVAQLVEAAQRKAEIDPALDTGVVVRSFFAMFGAAHNQSFSVLAQPDVSTLAANLVQIFARGVRAYPPTSTIK